MDGTDPSRESNQLRHEIDNVIYRYSQESGITAYQAVGVLEAIKMSLLMDLDYTEFDEDEEDGDDCGL